MATFDKDNDGTVNCAEFLLRFFLIGFQVSGGKAWGLALLHHGLWTGAFLHVTETHLCRT